MDETPSTWLNVKQQSTTDSKRAPYDGEQDDLFARTKRYYTHFFYTVKLIKLFVDEKAPRFVALVCK